MSKIDDIIRCGLIFLLYLFVEEKKEDNSLRELKITWTVPATPIQYIIHWVLPGLFILGFFFFIMLLIFKVVQ